MYVREQFAFAVVSFCDSVLFPADSFSSHPPVANYLISVQSIFGRGWVLQNISARGRRRIGSYRRRRRPMTVFIIVAMLDSIPRSSSL